MQKTTGGKPRSPRVKPAPAEAAEPVEVFVPTTVRAFLDLTDAQMRTIDLKISLTKAIRELRAASDLTQAEFAKRLGVKQPQAAKLESANPSTTLDTLVGAFFVLGGTGADLARIAHELDDLAKV